MRKKSLIILLNIVFIASAFGGDYASAFLDIGVGGKALSMGGAFCSIADDGTAFYWNPAGLGLIRNRLVSGMYGQQFGSLSNPMANFHYVGLVQPMAGQATIAINWIRLSVDEIPIYPELQGESIHDRLNNPSLRPTGSTGYFSDTEDAFFFSFAKMLASSLNMGWNYQAMRIDIPIGVNFKWIRQSLFNSKANGMGIDLGMMMRFYFSDLFVSDEFGVFSIGMNLQDFTTTHIKWNTDTQHEDNLPINVKWGVSYKQPLPFAKQYIQIAFDWDTRWHDVRRFGFAYSAFDRLGIRMGINGKNLTGGAGLRLWRVTLDYAFSTHDIDNLHRIGCQIKL